MCHRTLAATAIEKWCGVPVLRQFVMSLDADSGQVSIFPYKMALIPEVSWADLGFSPAEDGEEQAD